MQNNQVKNNPNDEDLDIYPTFKQALEKYPFIVIIGKYDHTLGPRAFFSSIPLKNEEFIRNLLRDALNTNNQFVILDFNLFYAQIYKIEIEDLSARGAKQLYAIILLRDVEYPIIPLLHFKRIGMIFHKIERDRILLDDKEAFEEFSKKINEIYMNKDEILPLESINMQIRSGVNTIQGFGALILDQNVNGKISRHEIINYIEMMLDSCNDIMEALEKQFPQHHNN
ncbi:hypothetical protein LCGC14_0879850 [marine sediment metagenome]|uniref:Uncharacterized protein n=1 Tax=marine sediment metagenome TaxID=412755 RepID=A0A0F9PMX7_9ZZZZ|nr:MAG: hypothetical protein Lokiarch_32850 [Candidatus Lokiarchaeum sp. GC14_75]